MNQPDKTAVRYNGDITIDFYEKYGRYSHIYKVRGRDDFLTSVTSATGMINKPVLIPWAVKMTKTFLIEKLEAGEAVTVDDVIEAGKQWRVKRDTAADKGTQVHEWAEHYIRFKLGELKSKADMPKDEQVLNGVMAFLSWQKEHKVEFIATEKLVYSKKHDYVGLLDCKAVIDGKLSVVDFKTSSGVYPEFYFQVSAYRAADEEESGEKYTGPNWIVKFDKDTADFDAHPFNDQPKNFKAFLGALAIKKRLKEIGNI